MTENAGNQNEIESKVKDAFLTQEDLKIFRSRRTWFIKRLPTVEERKYAKETLETYLENYPNIKLDQFELIKDIVYEEILKFRVQQLLNKAEAIYVTPVRVLHEIEDKLIVLKKKLKFKLKGVDD